MCNKRLNTLDVSYWIIQATIEYHIPHTIIGAKYTGSDNKNTSYQFTTFIIAVAS